MKEESQSNAANPCQRRLLRTVLPLHARTSGHHQGGGEAFGEHHCVRPGAHRRLSDDVWAPANSSRCVGSRHEKPQDSDASGVRSASTRPQVPNAPRGKSYGPKDGQALSIQFEEGDRALISARVRLLLLRRHEWLDYDAKILAELVVHLPGKRLASHVGSWRGKAKRLLGASPKRSARRAEKATP